MQRGEFLINGIKSADLSAWIVNNPAIPMPVRQVDLKEITGGNRSIAFDQASYSNREFELSIAVKAESQADRLAKQTKLLHAFDSGGYIPAVVYFDETHTYQIIRTGEVTEKKPATIGEHRVYTFKVSADPFKYLSAPTQTFVKSGTITNPTLYDSLPYIKIVGGGDIDLTVNGALIHFHGVTSQIELDSFLEDAYRNDAGHYYNENSKMQLTDFPTLKPGANTFSAVGTVTQILIEPRWRTL